MIQRCRHPRNRPRILRRRRVGQPRPQGHRGEVLQELMQTPKQNQRGQRPTGRRQQARLAQQRDRRQRHDAQQVGRDAEAFSIGQPGDHGRRAEPQQPDDLRGGADQADAQADPRGVQFLGPIDDQRRADQSVADRPDGAVPDGEPSRPAALENGRRGAGQSPSSLLVRDGGSAEQRERRRSFRWSPAECGRRDRSSPRRRRCGRRWFGRRVARSPSRRLARASSLRESAFLRHLARPFDEDLDRAAEQRLVVFEADRVLDRQQARCFAAA